MIKMLVFDLDDTLLRSDTNENDGAAKWAEEHVLEGECIKL
jgi:FMN phosphatase YigB (HAD superfamily)